MVIIYIVGILAIVLLLVGIVFVHYSVGYTHHKNNNSKLYRLVWSVIDKIDGR